MTRKKMLLFTLVISMDTVWRLLELLEYGEIEVRQVDTYMYFYMLATCFVAFLVGKESATIKAAKEQRMCAGWSKSNFTNKFYGGMRYAY